jgi:anti-sigma factor RsiW
MSIPESHLAQEAIAALVDGELPAGPASRAARHLAGCLQCRMAVQAQREAKAALHDCEEVAVPGDLMSRLRAIPFTTDVPGSDGGSGTLAAGPGELTVSGTSGAWSVDLRPRAHRPERSHHTARWLRRGLTGTLVGLGAGVAALALNLPAGDAATSVRTGGPVAGPSVPQQHSEVVPPVVRTLTVGTKSALSAPGGTP